MWLQLEEKRIPYTIEKINMRCYGDKPASFMAKVPRGLLPVIGARARANAMRRHTRSAETLQLGARGGGWARVGAAFCSNAAW